MDNHAIDTKTADYGTVFEYTQNIVENEDMTVEEIKDLIINCETYWKQNTEFCELIVTALSYFEDLDFFEEVIIPPFEIEDDDFADSDDDEPDEEFFNRLKEKRLAQIPVVSPEKQSVINFLEHYLLNAKKHTPYIEDMMAFLFSLYITVNIDFVIELLVNSKCPIYSIKELGEVANITETINRCAILYMNRFTQEDKVITMEDLKRLEGLFVKLDGHSIQSYCAADLLPLVKIIMFQFDRLQSKTITKYTNELAGLAQAAMKMHDNQHFSMEYVIRSQLAVEPHLDITEENLLEYVAVLVVNRQSVSIDLINKLSTQLLSTKFKKKKSISALWKILKFVGLTDTNDPRIVQIMLHLHKLSPIKSGDDFKHFQTCFCLGGRKEADRDQLCIPTFKDIIFEFIEKRTALQYKDDLTILVEQIWWRKELREYYINEKFVRFTKQLMEALIVDEMYENLFAMMFKEEMVSQIGDEEYLFSHLIKPILASALKNATMLALLVSCILYYYSKHPQLHTRLKTEFGEHLQQILQKTSIDRVSLTLNLLGLGYEELVDEQSMIMMFSRLELRERFNGACFAFWEGVEYALDYYFQPEPRITRTFVNLCAHTLDSLRWCTENPVAKRVAVKSVIYMEQLEEAMIDMGM